MHIILVVVVMLVVLLLGRSMEQKMFRGDPARQASFRRLLYRWSWRAAAIALLLAIIAAVWLRNSGAAI